MIWCKTYRRQDPLFGWVEIEGRMFYYVWDMASQDWLFTWSVA